MRLMLNGSIAVVLIVFLNSCTNNKDRKAYQVFDNGFTSSYKLINHQNQVVLANIENKKWELDTKEKADIWYPKAVAINKGSESMINYIESKKAKFKKEEIKELGDSLENYKQFVLNIDPSIKHDFYNHIDIGDSILKDEEKTLEEGYAPILSYLQNNVAITANTLLNFCNEHVGTFIEDFRQFSAIVGQNTKYAKAGEQIEIVAGIGAFSKAANPKISIAGMNISLSEDNAAHYTFKAPNQIGKHTMPVQIHFIDQDGRKQLIFKDVEFTVMK